MWTVSAHAVTTSDKDNISALSATPGGDFALTDQFGHPFTSKKLRGKVVLIFFGYTYCPDVCPMELGELAGVLRQVRKLDLRDQVQAVFVTVDPQRDTPAVLKQYLEYFDAGIIGLTGKPSEIHQVANAYHVSYQRHKQQDGGYIIDHSANLYVMDRKGALAAIIPFGFPSSHLMQVIRKLVRQR